MKMHPRSTRSRSFLYATLSGTRVCGELFGSRSPSVVQRQVLLVRLTLDTGELGEIVRYRLARVDVIVDEWQCFEWSDTSKNRHPGQRHTRRSKDILSPVRAEFHLLLYHQHGPKMGLTCCSATNSASIEMIVPG